MPRCPVCQSFQIVIVVSAWPEASTGVPGRPLGNAHCSRCRSRWVQRGSEQRAIETPDGQAEEVSLGRLDPLREPSRASGPAYPYSCPVCGIGLLHSDVEGSDTDYFCPYCITRQVPWGLGEESESDKPAVRLLEAEELVPGRAE